MINVQELVNKTANPEVLALLAIAEELGLLRKQIEKLDRTVGKLNEDPSSNLNMSEVKQEGQ